MTQSPPPSDLPVVGSRTLYLETSWRGIALHAHTQHELSVTWRSYDDVATRRGRRPKLRLTVRVGPRGRDRNRPCPCGCGEKTKNHKSV